jgi:hypothetical protein
MNTEKLEQLSSAKRSETIRPYFSLSDFFFIFIAGVVAIAIVQLGYSTWVEGRHTDSAKSTGESIVSWMTDAASKRASSDGSFNNACSGEDKKWLDCREWLVSASGPLKGVSNHISQGNKLFSSACDRTKLDTLGSIIFEKGTPKPPDGASLMYAPLADDELLKEPLPLRLSICGRGFSLIRVAEFTF